MASFRKPIGGLFPSHRAVAIIDADEAARGSTRWLLVNEGYHVLSFPSVEAFLAAPLSRAPACLLLDIDVPGGEGLDVLKRLAERDDCPPVLIASARAHLDVAVTAMKLGAADFVQKPYAPGELLSALADLTRPGAFGDIPGNGDSIRLVQSLPRRQKQVLAGIARGNMNKTIAWELQLSVRTVEYYRATLFRRLGIRSVAEAVRIAMAAGLHEA